MKLTRWILSAIVVVGAVSPALAAQTLYASRAAFNAAAGGGLSFESFEAQRNGATVFYPGVTVAEFSFSPLIVHTSNNAAFTAATTHLANSIWYIDNGGSLATFTFATPITAFGIDIAFNRAEIASFSGGISGSLALSANTPGFFGAISDTPFSTVVVDVSGAPSIGFDALAFGNAAATPVPEPATWAAMIAGFGLVGGAMRRRAAGSVRSRATA